MKREPTIAAVVALGVLTAAASLASPKVAAAGEPSAAGLQTRVYYYQRDLSSEPGIRSLYRRIVNAAEEVCPGSDSRYLDEVAARKECERRAIARAIAQIGNGRLAYVAQIAHHG
jgi:UrcA family protein